MCNGDACGDLLVTVAQNRAFRYWESRDAEYDAAGPTLLFHDGRNKDRDVH